MGLAGLHGQGWASLELRPGAPSLEGGASRLKGRWDADAPHLDVSVGEAALGSVSPGCTEASGVRPCSQSLVCRKPRALPPLRAPRNLCSKGGDRGPEVPPEGRDLD